MAKVTMVETPTEQILKEKNKIITISDSRGRKIKLKKPNILHTFNLVRMVGGDDALNQAYMSMILPLLYITEIDDLPVFLSNKSELDALIQRLDDEGIAAVNNAVIENFIEKPADEKEEIKK